MLNSDFLETTFTETTTRVKISQLVKLSTRFVRTAFSQLLTILELVVTILPTSLIRQQARSNLLRTLACISLVGTTCRKSVTVINVVTK
jgi:hypothetical protein